MQPYRGMSPFNLLPMLLLHACIYKGSTSRTFLEDSFQMNSFLHFLGRYLEDTF